jgi:hypothetical protein
VKHAVQRGILGTNSAFALGPRKTTKNFDRIDCGPPSLLSPGVRWPGRDADHSPASSTEVKNGGVIIPLLHTFSCHSA